MSRRRHDLLIAIGFAVVSAGAHLAWNPIVEYWQFVATALLVVLALSWWLARMWRRLELFSTKFYCFAVIFDILAEGLLQPFHHCTLNNLLCTGRMFLVFFVCWLVSQPIEHWVSTRVRKPGGAR